MWWKGRHNTAQHTKTRTEKRKEKKREEESWFDYDSTSRPNSLKVTCNQSEPSNVLGEAWRILFHGNLWNTNYPELLLYYVAVYIFDAETGLNSIIQKKKKHYYNSIATINWHMLIFFKAKERQCCVCVWWVWTWKDYILWACMMLINGTGLTLLPDGGRQKKKKRLQNSFASLCFCLPEGAGNQEIAQVFLHASVPNCSLSFDLSSSPSLTRVLLLTLKSLACSDT